MSETIKKLLEAESLAVAPQERVAEEPVVIEEFNPLKETIYRLNRLMNNELYGAYVYFAVSTLAAACEHEGCVEIIRDRAKAKLQRATEIADFIVSKGEQPSFWKIYSPPSDFNSKQEVVEELLYIERECLTDIEEIGELSAECAVNFVAKQRREQLEYIAFLEHKISEII